MKNEPHLNALKDNKGKATGYYRCSLCDMEFLYNPNKHEAMQEEFARHRAASHPLPKKPREDVNQAAARVVGEAKRD